MGELASELDVAAVLGERGIIGEHIDDFEPRASQLGMATLIAEAIALGESRVVEAATGIGKTFAYLVPAFLCDTRVVISTGTRNLQDQLFHKDIPLLRRAVVSQRKTALLKGRSNYCCRHRLRRYRDEDRFKSREMASLFGSLSAWAERSESGDIAEFADIPENDSLWYYATSNADNCLGGDCPDLDSCFVLRARRRAMDADILVINHHLYFSDLALKEEGFGEILPSAGVMIFDEAHQLPDVAAGFYGRQVTARQIDLLCRDTLEAEVAEAAESRSLGRHCDEINRAASDLRLALRRFPERAEWEPIRHAPATQQAARELGLALGALDEALEPMVARGKELAQCRRRLQGLRQAFSDFLEIRDDQVSWYEYNERGFRLARSPLEVAESFRQQLELADFGSVFFTSATLSSQHSFDYYCGRLGLDDLDCDTFDSPFDYPRQAMLYLPPELPDPADEGYARAFGDLCLRLIEAADGHSFILFTSYRMLEWTAGFLRERSDCKLLVQGEMQRNELLQQFIASRRPVLLGTSSFWEGVDVKGEQLRCVIIDKLPFRAPNDPVYRRRLQRIKQQGGNAFTRVQVPEATISLRQGAGRLIRDGADRGVVALCDSRVQSRSYGRGMLDSLPPMRRSCDLDEVLAFLREIDAAP